MVPGEILPDLPFDIIITILTMVSGEDLVRFMLVCRKWRNLIKNADFIIKHLQFWASRGNNYVLCGPEIYTPGKFLKLLTDKSHVQVLERKIPFDFRTNCYMLMSSANGLVFLADRHHFGPNLYLYNPFIHKCKPITSTCINVVYPGKCVHCYVLGFGYHSQVNDYKIVRIAYIKDEDDSDIDEVVVIIDDFSEDNINDDIVDDVFNYETEVEVFSLSTDSWRRVEVSYFPWFIHACASRALVNDCLHWMASTRYGNTGVVLRILSFDLGTEVFQTMRLPRLEIDVADTSKYCSPDVISYKDKLSLVAFSNGLNGCCSLWMMREYGVFDSWSWLFTVVLDGTRVGWPFSSSFTFTKHGELIYIHKEGYVVVNPFTQQRQNFRFGINDDPYEFIFLPLTNNLTLI